MYKKEDLLKFGFQEEFVGDLDVVEYNYRLDSNREIVVNPAFLEVFVYFEEEMIKVYIHTETVEDLIKVAQCLTTVE